MVGRERELGRLRDALAQAEATAPASSSRSSVPPASGSRGSSTSSSPGSTTPRSCGGRCLSYGEGITYWPVVEVAEAAARRGPGARVAELGLDSSAARAVEPCSATAAWWPRSTRSPGRCAGCSRRSRRDAARRRVRRHPLGRADVPRSRRPRRRPQPRRADPAALHGTPRAARPAAELGRRQAERHDRAARAAGAGEADALVDRLLDGTPADAALRARILDAAEGNPLFVEEMVSLVRESRGRRRRRAGDDPRAARRAARSARSGRAGRAGARIRRGAHRSIAAPSSAAPEEPQLGAPLTALVRKELLRPDQPQFPGEDAFRFRHLLIATRPTTRSRRRPAPTCTSASPAGSGSAAADLVELDEVVGYHLERAYRLPRSSSGRRTRPPGTFARAPPPAWGRRDESRDPRRRPSGHQPSRPGRSPAAAGRPAAVAHPARLSGGHC